MRYFKIGFAEMFSFGSLRVKRVYKYNDEKYPNTWWCELTFLCIEVNWGFIDKQDGEDN